MVDIIVPTLGESISSATVAKWFKQAGDAVAMDEPIVELETDKVTVEVNATAAGAIESIAAAEGDEVEVGAVLGSIKEGAAAAAPEAPAPAAEAAPAPATAPASDQKVMPAAAKAAASSTPSKSTGQQTQHSLKKEQRPKSCCRTTTAVKRVPLNRRSKGLQPEDPSKACETCGPVRKKASKTRGRSVVVSTPGAIARVKLRRGCSQPTTHVREGIPEESRSSRSIKNIA